MHRPGTFLLGVCLGIGGPLWAQSSEGTDPSIQISNVVQAPSSSVDLLRESIQKNSPFASPAKAPKVPTAPAQTKPSTAKNTPVTSKPAEAVSPSSVSAKVPASAPVAAVSQPSVPAPAPSLVKTPAEVPATPAVSAAPASVVSAAAPVAAVFQPSVPVPAPSSVKTPAEVPATPAVSTAPAGQMMPSPGLGARPPRPGQGRRPRIQTAPVSQQTVPAEPTVIQDIPEEDVVDAEQEYAVKMLEQAKQKALQGRFVPSPAAKNKPAKVPAANKKFNPNAFRPGVKWVASKSTHFDIYTQKAEGKIGSANMALTFETAYDTLRRFVPWMMSGRVRVFVYQDHDSYLRYEPEAKAWARAIAYPTRGEIVVYDESGHSQELKETFAHELTHIFTQQFFDKHNTGRIMTPTWLDEGLAVLVEDQMFAGKMGGPWNNDYRTLRFERDPKTMPASFGSSKLFGGFQPKPFVPISQRTGPKGPRRGKPVRLVAFEDFMKEGSLDAAEGQGETQNWYLQAYLMVRFLLNPGGGLSPSNRMQFEQFTRLISEGEAVRDSSTGFLVKDTRGKQVYEPYDVQKALGRAYRYNTISNFEDAFWKWLNK